MVVERRLMLVRPQLHEREEPLCKCLSILAPALVVCRVGSWLAFVLSLFVLILFARVQKNGFLELAL